MCAGPDELSQDNNANYLDKDKFSKFTGIYRDNGKDKYIFIQIQY